MHDAQNRRNSSPKDLGRSEPSEFHTERSRMLRTTGIPHRAILGAQTIGIPHRAVQDAQNRRNSSPSNPGRSEPSEFHTERSTMLKTIGIPHRATLGAQNRRNSTSSGPGSSKPLEFRTGRRSDLRPLRTIGIPRRAVQDHQYLSEVYSERTLRLSQNLRNSAPSDPGCSEPPEFRTERSSVFRAAVR